MPAGSNEVGREARNGPTGRALRAITWTAWHRPARVQRTSGMAVDIRCIAPTIASCSVRPSSGRLWLLGPKS